MHFTPHQALILPHRLERSPPRPFVVSQREDESLQTRPGLRAVPCRVLRRLLPAQIGFRRPSYPNRPFSRYIIDVETSIVVSRLLELP